MGHNSEAHADSYPCRPLPPTDNKVEHAKEDKGAAKRCYDAQQSTNRRYLNKHEECKNTEKGCS